MCKQLVPGLMGTRLSGGGSPGLPNNVLLGGVRLGLRLGLESKDQKKSKVLLSFDGNPGHYELPSRLKVTHCSVCRHSHLGLMKDNSEPNTLKGI